MESTTAVANGSQNSERMSRIVEVLILTQIAPVAHAGQDNDALPEVAGNVAYLTDDVPCEEPDGLVGERDEE